VSVLLAYHTHWPSALQAGARGGLSPAISRTEEPGIWMSSNRSSQSSSLGQPYASVLPSGASAACAWEAIRPRSSVVDAPSASRSSRSASFPPRVLCR
jgi:hypothetical protein